MKTEIRYHDPVKNRGRDLGLEIKNPKNWALSFCILETTIHQHHTLQMQTLPLIILILFVTHIHACDSDWNAEYKESIKRMSNLEHVEVVSNLTTITPENKVQWLYYLRSEIERTQMFMIHC